MPEGTVVTQKLQRCSSVCASILIGTASVSMFMRDRSTSYKKPKNGVDLRLDTLTIFDMKCNRIRPMTMPEVRPHFDAP